MFPKKILTSLLFVLFAIIAFANETSTIFYTNADRIVLDLVGVKFSETRTDGFSTMKNGILLLMKI